MQELLDRRFQATCGHSVSLRHQITSLSLDFKNLVKITNVNRALRCSKNCKRALAHSSEDILIQNTTDTKHSIRRMKERFKSYTAKNHYTLSKDSREPFEHIVLCEHLASTSCFNSKSGEVIDLLKRDLVCLLSALLHKLLSCLNLKTALFCKKFVM